MGGEQPPREPLAEQHVGNLFAVRHEARALLVDGDLLQRAGDAVGKAGELHRRGIREELPLA